MLTLALRARTVAARLRSMTETWRDPGDPSLYACILRSLASDLEARGHSATEVQKVIESLYAHADGLTGNGARARAVAEALRVEAACLYDALPGNTPKDRARAYFDALARAGYEVFPFNLDHVVRFARGEEGGYEGWLRARDYDLGTLEVVWLGRTDSYLGLAVKKLPIRYYHHCAREEVTSVESVCPACACREPNLRAEEGWGRVYREPSSGERCGRCKVPLVRPYALFLDDTRTVEAVHPTPRPNCGGWITATSLGEAQALVERYGMPYHLSLDFDLGVLGENGEVFLNWLLADYWLPRFHRGTMRFIPTLETHTSYPEGAAQMRAVHTTWRALVP